MKHLPVLRGDCIAGTIKSGSLDERRAGSRQCGVLSCRMNLLSTSSADMPGRRHNGLAPPASPSGEVISASAPSCALDVADAHPEGLSSAQVAVYLGQTKRAVELTVKRALIKLRANGANEADVDAMTSAAFVHAVGNEVI